jgi:hypothetical protein
MGEEFQPETVMPLLVGRGEEIAAPHRAGIVDQDVEPPAFLRDRLRQLVGRALAQQVGDEHVRGAARLADLGGDLVERRLVAPGERHRAAGLSERERDAAADPAARAGDQRGLAVQLEVHRAIPRKDHRASRRPSSII